MTRSTCNVVHGTNCSPAMKWIPLAGSLLCFLVLMKKDDFFPQSLFNIKVLHSLGNVDSEIFTALSAFMEF